VNVKIILVLLIGLRLASGVFASEPGIIAFQSGEMRTPLVELCTSEGCSSCPPADQFLSELTDSKGLWRDYVPVSFHVDYWDRLGWKDRFARAEFTERQRAYARTWKSRSVYTPAFVIDGREWKGFFEGELLPRSVNDRVGVLRLERVESRSWKLKFRPVKKHEGTLNGHIVIQGLGLDSLVSSGENRGRRLEHDFVVLSKVRVDLELVDGLWSARLPLDIRSEVKGEMAISCWVESGGRILQATGGKIPKVKRAKKGSN
jgi:hypothetical protein